MKKSIILDILKLAAIFGAIWFAFTLIPFGKLKDGALEISVENEKKLGDLMVEQIVLKQFTPIKNSQVDSALTLITKRLLKNIDTTEYDYKFFIIRNEQVNAFTLPGGNIFINSGLIEFSDKPEEVAAVLSHEIGHAEKRHVVGRLVKELGVSILFSILSGGDDVLLGEIARTAISTKFDREQEKEADDFALKLLEKSSISPTAIAAFFRRVNEKFGGYDSNEEILMTHPNNNSRIKKSLEYKTKSGFKMQVFDLDWTAVKESLKEKQ